MRDVTAGCHATHATDAMVQRTSDARRSIPGRHGGSGSIDTRHGRDRARSRPFRSDRWKPAPRSALAPRLDDDAPARGLDPLTDHAAFVARRAVAVAVAPVALVTRADVDANTAGADIHVLTPGGRRNHAGRNEHQAENHLAHRSLLLGSPDAENAGLRKMFRLRHSIARICFRTASSPNRFVAQIIGHRANHAGEQTFM